MELAIKENEKKPDASAKELVPEDLHNFLDIFDEEQAGQLPKSQPWDYKIEMKEGFEPKSFKNTILHRRNKIKELKLTCQSIALHIQPNGKTSYPPLNSPTTIDDMQID